jgi:hypothetical protein
LYVDKVTQSLDPLVIDGPALGAGGMIGAAETPTGMIPRPLPQPFSQRGIRVGLGLADRPVSLSAAVLPGDPAGKPFTDVHYCHKVVNGHSPTIRA